MRTYLVIMDESAEAEKAIHFAARRAAKTGGGVHIVAVTPPADFVQWGGVQEMMDEEARERAEQLVMALAGTLMQESGIRPTITVRSGEPIPIIRAILKEDATIAALVLAAAANGTPGPLVAHFTGAEAGKMPCPIMIVPGGLSPEELERLS
ncbi:universal stress protein [Sphingobium sp. DEHP117]|uniref:universal stress protein n=1 Tax=Sphingobium sp. DEHP117 TaxID=2993436 RepID=UPI0027D6867E|nr:universal stress protein [Sphingobium sp. DEHP117]MDQ4419707.1 universal stress protein [Sphingobium sp. DEHP117]